MAELAKAELGFIGAGNMAEAIAKGVLAGGVYKPAQLLASDPSAERRALFAGMGVKAVEDSAAVAAASTILVIAVKPQMIDAAAAQIRSAIRENTLVISIIAGLSAAFLERALSADGKKLRVVRVMPNTPMLVGKGMSALCKGTFATDADMAVAERIFGAAGQTVRIDEAAMDAVTALSGSGPAYVFLLAEAMAAAGEKLGLSPVQADQLARQTLVGAAALLAGSGDTPAELRRKVTSPKGTTQAAIETMQAGGFETLILRVMQAAAARSQELGR